MSEQEVVELTELEQAELRVQQLETESNRTAGEHNIILGRLLEARDKLLLLGKANLG